MNRYLIRLDDACPTMDRKQWGRMEMLLDKYGIRPLVGVIPDNKDEKQLLAPADPGFWENVKAWQEKGWEIALHGYDHCYISDKGKSGLNPIWRRSEFAGLSIDEQREKIRKGVAIMRENGINPKYFFAPSHTFDENTLNALREESDIRIVSDTIALQPYKYKDFVFIPQFSGQCRKMRMKGIFTFCFHPNTMENEAFIQTENFLHKHSSMFVSFDQLNLEKLNEKDIMSKMMSWLYFTRRNLLR